MHTANSKQGQPAIAKPGATLTINKDSSVTASGKLQSLDLYTVVGLADLGKPITARSSSKCSPTRACRRRGRVAADNGNLVLTEFRVGRS